MEKTLSYIYTLYGLDHFLKFLICKIISPTTKLKQFSSGSLLKKTLREIYTAKLKENKKKWTTVIEKLDINEINDVDMRQVLYEYNLSFLSWVLFQRQMGGISKQKSKRICKKFYHTWLESVKKTQELKDFSIQKEISVLFISANGGQGMQTVEDSFREHFDSQFKMKFIYPFDKTEPILPLITCNRISFKQVWEFGLKCRSPLFNQLIIRVCSPIYIFFNHSRVKRYIDKKIIKLSEQGCKPDLIINFVPYITSDIQNSAKSFNIPVIMYPTDMALKRYNSCNPSDTNFYIRIPFLSYSYIERSGFHNLNLRPGQLLLSGYAIKSNISTHKQVPQLETDNEISERELNEPGFFLDLAKSQDKKIITLTMGSIPSNKLESYADELIKRVDYKVHINIMTGKNYELLSRLKRKYAFATLDQPISVSLIDYTEKFTQFLEISDVVLIKTGAACVVESWNYSKPGRVLMMEPGYEIEQGNFQLSKDFKFSRTTYNPFGFAMQVNFLLGSEVSENTFEHEIFMEPSVKLKTSFSHMVSLII